MYIFFNIAPYCHELYFFHFPHPGKHGWKLYAKPKFDEHLFVLAGSAPT